MVLWYTPSIKHHSNLSNMAPTPALWALFLWTCNPVASSIPSFTAIERCENDAMRSSFHPERQTSNNDSTLYTVRKYLSNRAPLTILPGNYSTPPAHFPRVELGKSWDAFIYETAELKGLFIENLRALRGDHLFSLFSEDQRY